MRQAAAFLKDKTALFKEEPHTQVNKSGGRNHPPRPPLPPSHPPLHTRTHALTHSAPPCRQPAAKGLTQNALTKENYSVNSS